MTLLKLLTGNKNGTASIEAAIIMPVYLLITLGLCQIAMLFFWREVLDFATQSAARDIQIGAAQTSAVSANQFIQNTVCPAVHNLLNCSRLAVNSAQSTDFYADAKFTVIQNGSINTSAFLYCNGVPGKQMVLHITYMAPVFMGWFDYLSGTIASFNGSPVFPITSTAAFIDEFFPASQVGSIPCT